MNRRNPERLTLKTVAERLKVSTATISNAFNRPSQLSQELRESILSECKKIGYAGPGAESRSLKTAKTRVIGVMLSNQLSYSFSDPVANQMLQGLSQIFEEPEFNLLVMPSRNEIKGLNGIESFVDGFIVYGPPAPDRMRDMMFHRKAVIAVDFDHPGVVSINIDNRAAAAEIATHAFKHQPSNPSILGLRLCHVDQVRSIEDLSLYDEFSNITVQRLQGFVDASIIAESYIPEHRIWHIPDNASDVAYRAAVQALQQIPRPDLLLCMSDCIGLSAIQAAKDMGLSVPHDLLVTGFDGIPESLSAETPLTTIEQPSLEKGKLAAEIFLGKREEQNIIIKASLKIRESCPESYTR